MVEKSGSRENHDFSTFSGFEYVAGLFLGNVGEETAKNRPVDGRIVWIGKAAAGMPARCVNGLIIAETGCFHTFGDLGMNVAPFPHSLVGKKMVAAELPAFFPGLGFVLRHPLAFVVSIPNVQQG